MNSDILMQISVYLGILFTLLFFSAFFFQIFRADIFYQSKPKRVTPKRSNLLERYKKSIIEIKKEGKIILKPYLNISTLSVNEQQDYAIHSLDLFATLQTLDISFWLQQRKSQVNEGALIFFFSKELNALHSPKFWKEEFSNELRTLIALPLVRFFNHKKFLQIKQIYGWQSTSLLSNRVFKQCLSFSNIETTKNDLNIPNIHIYLSIKKITNQLLVCKFNLIHETSSIHDLRVSCLNWESLELITPDAITRDCCEINGNNIFEFIFKTLNKEKAFSKLIFKIEFYANDDILEYFWPEFITGLATIEKKYTRVGSHTHYQIPLTLIN